MGISGLFGSYDEAEAYMRSYEQQFMRYSPKNAAVAEASVGVALALLPRCLHAPVRQVLHTLSGPALRAAMVTLPRPACYLLARSCPISVIPY